MRGPLVVTAAALVVVGFVLSLGPEGVRRVYAWFADVVFGFQAIRAPARFAVVAMIGRLPARRRSAIAQARPAARAIVAVLAALMMAGVRRTRRWRSWRRRRPSTESAGGCRAAGAAAPCCICRSRSIARIRSFMVQSLEHERPIVNGYSGQRPSFFTSLVDALADPSSIEARATL